MIKINIPNTKRTEIANRHWDWFNNRAKTKFRKSNLKGRTYKDYILQTLPNTSWNEIEDIIKGDKNIFKKFIDKFGSIKDNNLLLAFGYANFTHSKKEWNAYEYCKALGINVCPYCNENFILTIGSTKEKAIRPQLDHFYPKEKFPYLSCSIFNLIPSCGSCNHIKSNNEVKIIYPYDEEFGDDFPFRVKMNNQLEPTVFIKENNAHSNNDKVKNSLGMFKINERYNEHQYELNNILQRYRFYSKRKLSEIIKLLSNIKDTSKFERIILGLPIGLNNEEYPLRKCREDIIKQLKETK